MTERIDPANISWGPKRKRFLVAVVIAIVIGAIFSLAYRLNLLNGLQLQSGDFFFRAADMRQTGGFHDRIVLVAIDDRSLDQLGHFAYWPRSHYAALVDRLAGAGARVAAFDILFAEPAPGDDDLATSIRNAGNVILPMATTTSREDYASKTGYNGAVASVRPIVPLAQSAAGLGHANIVPDLDGITRKIPVVINNGGQYEPGLGLAAVTRYLRRPSTFDSPVGDSHLSFAGRTVPLVDTNQMIINYIEGPRGSSTISFAKVSFVDAMRGEVPNSLFENKIVFIGAMASGLGDAFWTPMGRMVRGVEIQASAAHTMLTGNFLRPVPPTVIILSILLATFICFIAVTRLSLQWSIAVTLMTASTYLVAAFTLFDRGIVFNTFYPQMAIGATFLSLNVYNFAAERREKSELARTFGRYVSTSVAGKIMNSLDQGQLRLGAEKSEVTVAFADVRGFTGISENMPPETLTRILNLYLSIIISCIQGNNGTVNKFGGDSIMAIWNVPVKCEGHALLGVKAAIEAQQLIMSLKKEQNEFSDMEFGFGINTGLVVAGNVGSLDRLEYSVIGDAVNTAARLGNAAPGGKIWIGASTFEQLKGAIDATRLEPLAMKGKREPVQAYQVTGFTSFQPAINNSRAALNF